MSTLPTLIQALLHSSAYTHDTKNISILETHISWVLLTGPYAYKIKKPVDLGFLDFSSLEKRKRFCYEELRLNQRWAPDLYIKVVPITGSAAKPTMNGDAVTLEYAVQMRQFPQEAQLDRLLLKDKVDVEVIHKIADWTARFHTTATRVPEAETHGSPDTVLTPILENFEYLLPHIVDLNDKQRLADVSDWSQRSFVRWRKIIKARKKDGHIRECHGDLHLSNMILEGNSVLAFDCIEFSDSLRCIDTINDAAFLMMDLMARNRDDLAYAFLNRYLERTGDYSGIRLIDVYLVYRTMVRAKVAMFTMRNPDALAQEKSEAQTRFETHLSLAQRLSTRSVPKLIIMNGVSGSGKTYVSQELLGKLPAIRLRSDVERKRLFDVPVHKGSDSRVSQGIYTEDATKRTYASLADKTRELLSAGHTVIVDAAFLERHRRACFIDIANRLEIAYVIVRCDAPKTTLQRRIATRLADANDASEANLDVLEYQLRNSDALDANEMAYTVTIATGSPLPASDLITGIMDITKKAEQLQLH